MNQPWKLEEGLKLIRALEGRTREFGYHIALGGGVLNKGESDKDLDLYFLPFNNREVKEDAVGLISWLSSLWGDPETLGDYPDSPALDLEEPILPAENRPYDFVEWAQSLARPKEKPTSSYKFKLKFERTSDDRIDVFII